MKYGDQVLILTYLIIKLAVQEQSMLLLGNIIFFIFGGFIILFGYVLGGVILCLTIVGFPLAVQHIVEWLE